MRTFDKIYAFAIVSLVWIGFQQEVYAILEEGQHYTNTWVVEFKHDLPLADVEDFAATHGLLNRGRVRLFL